MDGDVAQTPVPPRSHCSGPQSTLRVVEVDAKARKGSDRVVEARLRTSDYAGSRRCCRNTKLAGGDGV